ncbi:DUF5107 domain-containing protein [Paenibacillus guangzhouensis]|uniref:DUF5107 domain-containing protein n=1 Tax=Paenibacillus guangzhouensis TaxID=1473112 RepID=UPI00187BBBBE|nr:DUF5107 domain-containing protein [Paenibacillus guangzhouensis]
MKVSLSTLYLEGTPVTGENPLPMFRNRHYHIDVAENGTFTAEQHEYLGYETGERYLPYRMQDRYTRERNTIGLKVIILENDILKATFLPEYGGRLYALRDKRTDREILYRNPVLQPANLSILNAWFSGGIEWNIGQVGHTFTTCSPLHAAALKDEEGNEFLRLYEYERCKNIFWHIDCHLPPGAEQLAVYVRMVNDSDKPVPMYWWTNIAVEETQGARVFSSTSKVIYLDPEIKGFGLDDLPHLPSAPQVDASYPMRIPFSNEYFFQTDADHRSPWEAVAYEDGRLFYERSTPLLRYRKMFCWGNHRGGRRWCDFLAKPGEGNYIEVQGGLAPTQRHGIDMPAHTVWDFTQMFGVTQVQAAQSLETPWREAKSYIQGQVDSVLSEDEVHRTHLKLQGLAEKQPARLLSRGSGWGALERVRRERQGEQAIPLGFVFEDITLDAPQYPWLALLEEGWLPDQDVRSIPASWMIQAEWFKLLEASISRTEQPSWVSLLHYGVMLYEEGREEEAVEAWEKSLCMTPSAWVYRNLAVVKQQQGDTAAALTCYEQAYALANGFPDRAFVEEYLNLLIASKAYQQAWDVYEALPAADAASDRIQIMMGTAALELDKHTFIENLFRKEFAVIREGEVRIVDIWYHYHAKQLANARHTKVTPEILEEAMANCPPPVHIDFRLISP